jgi:hypothetical protein
VSCTNRVIINYKVSIFVEVLDSSMYMKERLSWRQIKIENWISKFEWRNTCSDSLSFFSVAAFSKLFHYGNFSFRLKYRVKCMSDAFFLNIQSRKGNTMLKEHYFGFIDDEFFFKLFGINQENLTVLVYFYYFLPFLTFIWQFVSDEKKFFDVNDWSSSKFQSSRMISSFAYLNVK